MASVTERDILRMKNALREEAMPMFEDAELAEILEGSADVREAIYKAAIMKSENTSLVVSGVTVADTSSYFLRIARMYRPNNTGILKGD